MTSGPVNSVVTISGSNFGSTLGSVTFYNNKAATVTNWTSGSITTSVPVAPPPASSKWLRTA